MKIVEKKDMMNESMDECGKENVEENQEETVLEEQDALKEKIDELEDRVKRQMAEFDNFRKRTDKEKSAMFETGAKSVIEKILPVVDNFERGLAAIPESEKGSAFTQGMEMIYKQLMTELESMQSGRNLIPSSTMRSCRWKARNTNPVLSHRNCRKAIRIVTMS